MSSTTNLAARWRRFAKGDLAQPISSQRRGSRGDSKGNRPGRSEGPSLLGNSNWRYLLIALGVLGVALMILGRPPATDQPPTRETGESDDLAVTARPQLPGGQTSTLWGDDYSGYLEAELGAVLSQVAGVGNVKVFVTLSSGSEVHYAYNETSRTAWTTEQDGSGTRLETEESEVSRDMVLIRDAGSGSDTPVIIRETKPKAAGVLIVADGAQNEEIKLEILRAAQAVLRVPAHAISVLPKK